MYHHTLTIRRWVLNFSIRLGLHVAVAKLQELKLEQ